VPLLLTGNTGGDFRTGDLNTDGKVDTIDLMLMASEWLKSDSLADIAPDPDGDDIVNFIDFAILAENWVPLLYWVPDFDRLVGWWKLDEGSGDSAADSSNHGNNGMVSVHRILDN